MNSHTSLEKQLYGFPNDLTYEDFLGLPKEVRYELVQRNRVLQTDTYNRTMNHVKGEDWRVPENYVLQLRRAPRGYLITHGIRHRLHHLFHLPITENEVRFAKDFYSTRSAVPYFNETMWQEVVHEHDGVVPLTIHSVPEGTAVLASDPVLRVEGPGELAAHFEPDFHRIFYPTLTATDAHMIAKKIGANRFVEFGKRGSATEELHMIALDAMLAGSGIGMTSNDAMVAADPERFKDAGTIGHRFLQFYDSEEEAMRQALENTDQCALLVDLTNSKRGIDTVIRLKKEYRSTSKKIWIRLDSGDLTTLAIYALTQMQEAGFTDPALDKVVIEDLSEISDMINIDYDIREAGFDEQAYVIYGAGSLLTTKDKSRGDASSGYKLSARMVGNSWSPRAKIPEDSPGKASLPGKPTLYHLPDTGRVIGQAGEFEARFDLSVLAYDPCGNMYLPDNVERIWEQIRTTFPHVQDLFSTRTPLSDQTNLMLSQLRSRYDI